jgi:hypothetical protein
MTFDRRMFRYFARLHEKYILPIYPIVVFSYDKPKKAAQSSYQVAFPDFRVLEFNYRTIQLNRLNWRDFLNQQNPVASALMVKMRIVPKDRPKVKAECLIEAQIQNLSSPQLEALLDFTNVDDLSLWLANLQN